MVYVTCTSYVNFLLHEYRTQLFCPQVWTEVEKYLEKMVAQLPRLYLRGPDILAVQSPLKVEKRGIAVGILRPSSLN